MQLRASFRVPYWPAFAATATLAPLGVVLVALWIDGLAHLMVAGPALAVVVVQLVLLVTAGAVVAGRFEYLTLYRLDLDGLQVSGRSTLKSWDFSLSEVEAIVPGWTRPWWSADHNRYVVELAGGGRLFVWSGKGLRAFLDCVAACEPRLRITEEHRSRAERSRGRSGFRSGICSDVGAAHPEGATMARQEPVDDRKSAPSDHSRRTRGSDDRRTVPDI